MSSRRDEGTVGEKLLYDKDNERFFEGDTSAEILSNEYQIFDPETGKKILLTRVSQYRKVNMIMRIDYTRGVVGFAVESHANDSG